MNPKPLLLNSITPKTHLVIEAGKLIAVISLPKTDESWKYKVVDALTNQLECDKRREEDTEELLSWDTWYKKASAYDYNAPVEIMKYGERYWAVMVGGNLLAVVLYRKGAEAIKGLIEGMRGG